jgi:hypothetical protein
MGGFLYMCIYTDTVDRLGPRYVADAELAIGKTNITMCRPGWVQMGDLNNGAYNYNGTAWFVLLCVRYESSPPSRMLQDLRVVSGASPACPSGFERMATADGRANNLDAGLNAVTLYMCKKLVSIPGEDLYNRNQEVATTNRTIHATHAAAGWGVGCILPLMAPATCDNGPAGQFLRSPPPPPSPSPPPPPALPTLWFLVDPTSKLCVDTLNVAALARAAVLRPCNASSDSQAFLWDASTTQLYSRINRSLCLDASSGVLQWDLCEYDDALQHFVYATASSMMQMPELNGGSCLAHPGGFGSAVTVIACVAGSSSQMFSVVTTPSLLPSTGE